MSSEKQFGFRKVRPCVTKLLSFILAVHVLQEIDGWVDCVYLDLEKAFDRAPHKHLMCRRKHIGGLNGSVLQWAKD